MKIYQEILACVTSYLSREDGATVVEYGLIAAGMGIAIITAVFLFGEEMVISFGLLDSTLSDVNQGLEAE